MKLINLDTLQYFYRKINSIFVQRLYPLVLKPVRAEWADTGKFIQYFYELLLPKKAVSSGHDIAFMLFKVRDKKYKLNSTPKMYYQDKRWTPLKIYRYNPSTVNMWNYGQDYTLQEVIAEGEVHIHNCIPIDSDRNFTLINGEEYFRADFTQIDNAIRGYFIEPHPYTNKSKIRLLTQDGYTVSFEGAPDIIFQNGYTFRLYNNYRGTSSFKYVSLKYNSFIYQNGKATIPYHLSGSTNIIFGIAAIDLTTQEFITNIVPIRANIRPTLCITYNEDDAAVESQKLYYNIKYFHYNKDIQEGVITTSFNRRS
jgi:hypothetical protein